MLGRSKQLSICLARKKLSSDQQRNRQNVPKLVNIFVMPKVRTVISQSFVFLACVSFLSWCPAESLAHHSDQNAKSYWNASSSNLFTATSDLFLNTVNSIKQLFTYHDAKAPKLLKSSNPIEIKVDLKSILENDETKIHLIDDGDNEALDLSRKRRAADEYEEVSVSPNLGQGPNIFDTDPSYNWMNGGSDVSISSSTSTNSTSSNNYFDLDNREYQSDTLAYTAEPLPRDYSMRDYLDSITDRSWRFAGEEEMSTVDPYDFNLGFFTSDSPYEVTPPPGEQDRLKHEGGIGSEKLESSTVSTIARSAQEISTSSSITDKHPTRAGGMGRGFEGDWIDWSAEEATTAGSASSVITTPAPSVITSHPEKVDTSVETTPSPSTQGTTPMEKPEISSPEFPSSTQHVPVIVPDLTTNAPDLVSSTSSTTEQILTTTPVPQEASPPLSLKIDTTPEVTTELTTTTPHTSPTPTESLPTTRGPSPTTSESEPSTTPLPPTPTESHPTTPGPSPTTSESEPSTTPLPPTTTESHPTTPGQSPTTSESEPSTTPLPPTTTESHPTTPGQSPTTSESEPSTTPLPPTPTESHPTTPGQSPTTSESEPSTTPLPPTPTESHPTTRGPSPTTSESEPSTTPLPPTTTESHPTTRGPSPTTSESEPSTTPLPPTPTESHPTTRGPGPTTSESEPSTTPLPPTPTESHPTTPGPSPTTSESEPSTTPLPPTPTESHPTTPGQSPTTSESEPSTTPLPPTTTSSDTPVAGTTPEIVASSTTVQAELPSSSPHVPIVVPDVTTISPGDLVPSTSSASVLVLTTTPESHEFTSTEHPSKENVASTEKDVSPVAEITTPMPPSTEQITPISEDKHTTTDKFQPTDGTNLPPIPPTLSGPKKPKSEWRRAIYNIAKKRFGDDSKSNYTVIQPDSFSSEEDDEEEIENLKRKPGYENREKMFVDLRNKLRDKWNIGTEAPKEFSLDFFFQKLSNDKEIQELLQDWSAPDKDILWIWLYQDHIENFPAYEQFYHKIVRPKYKNWKRIVYGLIKDKQAEEKNPNIVVAEEEDVSFSSTEDDDTDAWEEKDEQRARKFEKLRKLLRKSWGVDGTQPAFTEDAFRKKIESDPKAQELVKGLSDKDLHLVTVWMTQDVKEDFKPFEKFYWEVVQYKKPGWRKAIYDQVKSTYGDRKDWAWKVVDEDKVAFTSEEQQEKTQPDTPSKQISDRLRTKKFKDIRKIIHRLGNTDELKQMSMPEFNRKMLEDKTIGNKVKDWDQDSFDVLKIWVTQDVIDNFPKYEKFYWTLLTKDTPQWKQHVYDILTKRHKKAKYLNTEVIPLSELPPLEDISAEVEVPENEDDRRRQEERAQRFVSAKKELRSKLKSLEPEGYDATLLKKKIIDDPDVQKLVENWPEKDIEKLIIFTENVKIEDFPKFEKFYDQVVRPKRPLWRQVVYELVEKYHSDRKPEDMELVPTEKFTSEENADYDKDEVLSDEDKFKRKERAEKFKKLREVLRQRWPLEDDFNYLHIQQKLAEDKEVQGMVEELSSKDLEPLLWVWTFQNVTDNFDKFEKFYHKIYRVKPVPTTTPPTETTPEVSTPNNLFSVTTDQPDQGTPEISVVETTPEVTTEPGNWYSVTTPNYDQPDQGTPEISWRDDLFTTGPSVTEDLSMYTTESMDSTTSKQSEVSTESIPTGHDITTEGSGRSIPEVLPISEQPATTTTTEPPTTTQTTTLPTEPPTTSLGPSSTQGADVKTSTPTPAHTSLTIPIIDLSTTTTTEISDKDLSGSSAPTISTTEQYDHKPTPTLTPVPEVVTTIGTEETGTSTPSATSTVTVSEGTTLGSSTMHESTTVTTEKEETTTTQFPFPHLLGQVGQDITGLMEEQTTSAPEPSSTTESESTEMPEVIEETTTTTTPIPGTTRTPVTATKPVSSSPTTEPEPISTTVLSSQSSSTQSGVVSTSTQKPDEVVIITPNVPSTSEASTISIAEFTDRSFLSQKGEVGVEEFDDSSTTSKVPMETSPPPTTQGTTSVAPGSSSTEFPSSTTIAPDKFVSSTTAKPEAAETSPPPSTQGATPTEKSEPTSTEFPSSTQHVPVIVPEVTTSSDLISSITNKSEIVETKTEEITTSPPSSTHAPSSTEFPTSTQYVPVIIPDVTTIAPVSPTLLTTEQILTTTPVPQESMSTGHPSKPKDTGTSTAGDASKIEETTIPLAPSTEQTTTPDKLITTASPDTTPLTSKIDTTPEPTTELTTTPHTSPTPTESQATTPGSEPSTTPLPPTTTTSEIPIVVPLPEVLPSTTTVQSSSTLETDVTTSTPTPTHGSLTIPIIDLTTTDLSSVGTSASPSSTTEQYDHKPTSIVPPGGSSPEVVVNVGTEPTGPSTTSARPAVTESESTTPADITSTESEKVVATTPDSSDHTPTSSSTEKITQVPTAETSTESQGGVGIITTDVSSTHERLSTDKPATSSTTEASNVNLGSQDVTTEHSPIIGFATTTTEAIMQPLGTTTPVTEEAERTTPTSLPISTTEQVVNVFDEKLTTEGTSSLITTTEQVSNVVPEHTTTESVTPGITTPETTEPSLTSTTVSSSTDNLATTSTETSLSNQPSTTESVGGDLTSSSSAPESTSSASDISTTTTESGTVTPTSPSLVELTPTTEAFIPSSTTAGGENVGTENDVVSTEAPVPGKNDSSAEVVVYIGTEGTTPTAVSEPAGKGDEPSVEVVVQYGTESTPISFSGGDGSTTEVIINIGTETSMMSMTQTPESIPRPDASMEVVINRGTEETPLELVVSSPSISMNTSQGDSSMEVVINLDTESPSMSVTSLPTSMDQSPGDSSMEVVINRGTESPLMSVTSPSTSVNSSQGDSSMELIINRGTEDTPTSSTTEASDDGPSMEVEVHYGTEKPRPDEAPVTTSPSRPQGRGFGDAVFATESPTSQPETPTTPTGEGDGTTTEPQETPKETGGLDDGNLVPPPSTLDCSLCAPPPKRQKHPIEEGQWQDLLNLKYATGLKLRQLTAPLNNFTVPSDKSLDEDTEIKLTPKELQALINLVDKSGITDINELISMQNTDFRKDEASDKVFAENGTLKGLEKPVDADVAVVPNQDAIADMIANAFEKFKDSEILASLNDESLQQNGRSMNDTVAPETPQETQSAGTDGSPANVGNEESSSSATNDDGGKELNTPITGENSPALNTNSGTDLISSLPHNQPQEDDGVKNVPTTDESSALNSESGNKVVASLPQNENEVGKGVNTVPAKDPLPSSQWKTISTNIPVNGSKPQMTQKGRSMEGAAPEEPPPTQTNQTKASSQTSSSSSLTPDGLLVSNMNAGPNEATQLKQLQEFVASSRDKLPANFNFDNLEKFNATELWQQLQDFMKGDQNFEKFSALVLNKNVKTAPENPAMPKVWPQLQNFMQGASGLGQVPLLPKSSPDITAQWKQLDTFVKAMPPSQPPPPLQPSQPPKSTNTNAVTKAPGETQSYATPHARTNEKVLKSLTTDDDDEDLLDVKLLRKRSIQDNHQEVNHDASVVDFLMRYHNSEENSQDNRDPDIVRSLLRRHGRKAKPSVAKHRRRTLR